MRGGILEYYKNLGEGREVDFIVTQNLLAKAISNYRFLGATPDKRNGKYFLQVLIAAMFTYLHARVARTGAFYLQHVY